MQFGERVRRLREQHGLQQAQLARIIPLSAAHLSRIESGGNCSVETAAAIDKALGADGRLLCVHQTRVVDPQHQMRKESERLSQLLAESRPGELVTQIVENTERLAIDYLAISGGDLVEKLSVTRRQAVQSLRARRLRHHCEVRDITAQIGYLSGILSYVALDAGATIAAYAHTEAAWQAAEAAGSDQLRAWVRGTQSLILRFDQKFPEALAHAEDGLRFATTGTGKARLFAGLAQCHANMGDALGSRRALKSADRAFEHRRGLDELSGLFTFTEAKLHYYSGSSLIWLQGGADARRARKEAHTAIQLWHAAGPERSIADETLAHIYAATAALQLHDVDAATEDLEPILSLPPHQRISWVVKRMGRVADILGAPPFTASRPASDLLDRILAYAA